MAHRRLSRSIERRRMLRRKSDNDFPRTQFANYNVARDTRVMIFVTVVKLERRQVRYYDSRIRARNLRTFRPSCFSRKLRREFCADRFSAARLQPQNSVITACTQVFDQGSTLQTFDKTRAFYRWFKQRTIGNNKNHVSIFFYYRNNTWTVSLNSHVETLTCIKRNVNFFM